jgi:hypothetical protein
LRKRVSCFPELGRGGSLYWLCGAAQRGGTWGFTFGLPYMSMLHIGGNLGIQGWGGEERRPFLGLTTSSCLWGRVDLWVNRGRSNVSLSPILLRFGIGMGLLG